MARHSNQRRRIDELIAFLARKRGDLDTSNLNDEQREWLEHWRKRCVAYAAAFAEPDEYYTRSLTFDRYPMREDIDAALHGDHIISIDDDEETAAEKYRKAIER